MLMSKHICKQRHWQPDPFPDFERGKVRSRDGAETDIVCLICAPEGLQIK